ncbi:MAG: signal recognition particle-docking protein FtsY, partial [Candidatus Limnocylindria bacterium]
MPALSRLGSGLGARLRSALGVDALPNDAAWEAAEDALVAADLGPRLAADVIARARQRTSSGE